MGGGGAVIVRGLGFWGVYCEGLGLGGSLLRGSDYIYIILEGGWAQRGSGWGLEPSMIQARRAEQHVYSPSIPKRYSELSIVKAPVYT